MKKNLSILLFLFVLQFGAFGQEAINKYKYIIIPKQFEFLGSEDQYQINSLAKFLFNKYGYTAFLEGEEVPADLEKNGCLALKANVEDVKGGFLKTKLRINLLDCRNNIIAESEVGETREKEYSKAYNFALRAAFRTFRNFDYEYQPNNSIASGSSETITTITSDINNKESSLAQAEAKKEIERLRQEVEALKTAKENQVATNEVLKVEELETSEREDETKEVKDVSEAKVNTEQRESIILDTALYAQPMDNGFQVVDTEPKKVMFLLKTSLKDVFTVEGTDDLVYKKEGQWIYETQNDSQPKTEIINLKF